MVKWICKEPREFRRSIRLFLFWETRKTLWKRIIWVEPCRLLTGKEFIDHVNSRNSQRRLGFFLELDNTWTLLGASLIILLEIFDDLRSNKDKYCLTWVVSLSKDYFRIKEVTRCYQVKSALDGKTRTVT